MLNNDFPEDLLRSARQLARSNPTNARLAQLLGLAARAAGIGPEAYYAFRTAARLNECDPLIAHSYARSALEAGKPARLLFERALRLNPTDSSVFLGYAAALYASGEWEKAIELLSAALTTNPLWIEGHEALAKISSMLGQDPVSSVDAAIKLLPTSIDLHKLRINLALQARQFERAKAFTAQARKYASNELWLARMSAHTASELGDIEEADKAFQELPMPSDALELSLVARHHLKAGRPEAAAALFDNSVNLTKDRHAWPYLALAWRLIDDPRYAWLEGDETLIGTYDLGLSDAELAALAEILRSLHLATSPPLDQSVRNGTQTDGNLLLLDNQIIQDLRSRILQATERYVARLAPAQENHPTLISRRAPLRIAGSWSARLTNAGFHTDHIHTQGWLSSAFYVTLPDSTKNEHEKAGWLTFGGSRDLLPDIKPTHEIQPKSGHLVLFPSTMWHGTRPFPEGERMTVAFDITLPKQY